MQSYGNSEVIIANGRIFWRSGAATLLIPMQGNRTHEVFIAKGRMILLFQIDWHGCRRGLMSSSKYVSGVVAYSSDCHGTNLDLT